MPKNTKTDEEITEYFRVVVAEKKIEIECQYRGVFIACRDYLAKFDTPDILIPLVTPEEMEREREAVMGASCELFDYPDAAYESMAICRKLAEGLLDEGFLLFHGAAIAAKGKCYLFMAKSGTGKTTHIEKWLKLHPESFVVNGDKPLIDMNTLLLYGTPWCGKERYNTNTALPLGGLIWLERGAENQIAPISFSRMLPCLIRQCHIPKDHASTVKVMRLLDKLKDVPCWHLKCNMEDAAGEVSYHALVR